jgi:hypothetical protein
MPARFIPSGGEIAKQKTKRLFRHQGKGGLSVPQKLTDFAKRVVCRRFGTFHRQPKREQATALHTVPA